MCNAANHPPGCTCGWGGDGHLGRRSYRAEVETIRSAHTNLVLSIGRLGVMGSRAGFSNPIFVSPTYKELKSFTNPNARCPKCDQLVFFYQSEHGGRVFFDRLGPPWPKHPCTDLNARSPHQSPLVQNSHSTDVGSRDTTLPIKNGDRFAIGSLAYEQNVDAASTPVSILFSVSDQGWEPLLVSRIEVHKEGGYSKIKCEIKGKAVEIFIAEWTLPNVSPYLFKQISPGRLVVATVNVNEDGAVSPISCAGFTGLLDLTEHMRVHKAQRKITLKAKANRMPVVIKGAREIKSHSAILENKLEKIKRRNKRTGGECSDSGPVFENSMMLAFKKLGKKRT